jgi:hypothetical protein
MQNCCEGECTAVTPNHIHDIMQLKIWRQEKIIPEFRKSPVLLCSSLLCDLITILSIVEGMFIDACIK